MAFSLHDFIMAGLRDAVGKLNDYQIVLNSLGWMEKGVLTESDLEELQALMAARNSPLLGYGENQDLEELEV